MRRLVAVFAGKRSDKSDAASNASSMDRSSSADRPKGAPAKRSGFFKTKSLSRTSAAQPDSEQRKPPTLPMFTVTDHAPSSSSSSSGAPSTRYDDTDSTGASAGTKSWMPLTYLHDKVLAPVAAQDPSRPYVPRTFREDDDTSSAHSEELAQFQLPTAAKHATVSKSLPIVPSAYCRAIASNALEPPFSPPPLLIVPNAPLYPRSCNNPRQLSKPVDSLRYQFFQKRLMRRLDSIPADRYLAPYAHRQALPAKPLSLNLDDVAISRNHHVATSSVGLRRWIERPCFEDRVLIFLPAENINDDVRCERVTAAAAVEALGYSEAVDLLAGMFEDAVTVPTQDLLATSPTLFTPPLSSNPSTSSLPSLPPSPAPFLTNDTAVTSAQGTKPFPTALYKSSPSPLRIDNSGNPSTDIKARTSASKSVSTPAIPTTSASPAPSPKITMTPPANDGPRVGVRFAEDDKDVEDSIPLDYVMRIKQARDQKARFLAAERARRQSVQGQTRPSSVRPSLENPQQIHEDLKRVAEERRRLEEDKKRQEAGRRKQEEERRKWEMERAAWEREKKFAEEERRQKAYADELVEARRRRESSRQGTAAKPDNMMSWNGDREKERERKGDEARPRYHRPKYDDVPGSARREASESESLPASSSSLRLQIPSNSSPGSSGPPSIATGSIRGSSRPPSMYSTPPSSASAVDVRQRRESKASRRTSIMSDASALAGQQMFMQQGMPSGYPWGVPSVPVTPVPMAMNMNMMPVAMPMPMMQMQMPMMPYADMPLLPPSAPFMQQSGPRQHRSHSASPTRSRQSSSSDRGHGASGASSPHGSHRRMPSDELPKRPGDKNRLSSYGTPLGSPSLPRQSSSTTSVHSDRMRTGSNTSHRQSQPLPTRPTPVQTRTQPAFQNLSRPPPDRRQTMIR